MLLFHLTGMVSAVCFFSLDLNACNVVFFIDAGIDAQQLFSSGIFVQDCLMERNCVSLVLRQIYT